MINVKVVDIDEFREMLEVPKEFSLEHIHLKYYMSPFSWFEKQNKNHFFFLVLGEPVHNEDYGFKKTPVIGMTELKIYPGNKENEWSMPYITVDPKHQRKEIATELYKSVCAFLKERNATLIRTANSESGISFQHKADAILHEYKVPWMQNDRTYKDYSEKIKVSDFESLESKLIYLAQTKNKEELQKYAEDPLYHESFYNITDMQTNAFIEICKHIPELLSYFDKSKIDIESKVLLLEDYVRHKNTGFANLMIQVQDKVNFYISAASARSSRLDIRDTNLWDVILSDSDKNAIEEKLNELKLNFKSNKLDFSKFM